MKELENKVALVSSSTRGIGLACAMALGHPLGATGAMLTCKALSYLERTGGRYGMVTMCIGGGMGAAGIFECL